MIFGIKTRKELKNRIRELEIQNMKLLNTVKYTSNIFVETKKIDHIGCEVYVDLRREPVPKSIIYERMMAEFYPHLAKMIDIFSDIDPLTGQRVYHGYISYVKPGTEII